MQNILAGFRTTSTANNISKVTIQDIVAVKKIVDFRMVTHKATGNDYLHLIAADGQYLPVRLGKKVTLTATTLEAKVTELLKNFVIYTGVGDSRRPAGDDNKQVWFTFGTVGEFAASPVVSAASIFAAMGNVNATQQLETA